MRRISARLATLRERIIPLEMAMRSDPELIERSPEQYVGGLLCRRHQAHGALKLLDQHTHRLS